MTRHVEQILFGWTSKGGLGTKRHSPGLTDFEVDSWADRLSKYIRLSPTMVDHRPWAPKKAFSYFEFPDGKAALLARFDTGERGRNTSHALVGTAAVLGPYAMALSTWDRWCAEDYGSSLPSVDPRDWKWYETSWQDGIRVGAHERRSAVIALAREVLLGEATHFTVLVDLAYDPLPLLALVRDVLDPVLSVPGKDFGWTFSTYEESDTTPEALSYMDGAPRFWFVRSLPTSGQADRRRVLVGQRPEDDAYCGLAADLVTTYLQNPNKYPANIEQGLSGIDDPAGRVAHLVEPYQRPVPQNVPVVQPAAEVHPEVSTSDEQVGRHLGENTTVAVRKQLSPRSMDVDQLLTALYEGNGLTRQQTRDYVAELRNQWDSQNPYVAHVTRTVNRVERRLTRHERVLGVMVVGLVLVALLAFLTARREVTVPTLPTVTVTHTPPPQPAEPPDGER